MSSTGLDSRRLDNYLANGPEERRDTSPSASNLAASTPNFSQTRLRNTLHNSPARHGHSSKLFSPARGRLPLRAKDWNDEDDHDVPTFTPLPPPRLLVPRDALRPGQYLNEDRSPSPISSRPRVSPTTWSPLFRARQHYPPTKSNRTPTFETPPSPIEPESRIEEWLENVRPSHCDVSAALRGFHLSPKRRDSAVEHAPTTTPLLPPPSSSPSSCGDDTPQPSTSKLALPSPSCPRVSPQPRIMLSPPSQPPDQQHFAASPLTHRRRRPRQRGPAPAPAPEVSKMIGDAGQAPVTPKSTARKSRFGGGNEDGQVASMMLSPDVYLWRGDSERRSRYREVVRSRCASYYDADIAVEESS